MWSAARLACLLVSLAPTIAYRVHLGRASRSSLRAQPVMSSTLEFFDPLERFGPLNEEPVATGPPFDPEEPIKTGNRRDKPLMIVLPGLDGSAVTAWTQYPELGREYELRALRIGADDRSSYASLVDRIAEEVAGARAAGREVVVVGESMGAGVALDCARKQPAPSAIVLISPATSWDRTWLGKLRSWLVTLPDALLTLVVAATTYQVRQGHSDKINRLRA